MDAKRTGALIAARRQELSLTQKQLAEQLNVSDRTVSKWERGAGFPDVSLLEPIADALGLSLIELMHGERLPEEEQPSPEAENSARKLAEALAEHFRWNMWKYKRALIILCVILAIFIAAYLWLWFYPIQVDIFSYEEVSPAEALEIYSYAMITTDEFKLAQMLLDDPEVGGYLDPAVPDFDSHEPPEEFSQIFPDDETVERYRALYSIDGDPVDSLELWVSSKTIINFIAKSGDKVSGLSIFYDCSLIRKTVWDDSKNNGNPPAVTTENNTVFTISGPRRRDLFAPFFLPNNVNIQ